MALRGVWQLQKLIVSYCDWGGSSRGIRYLPLYSSLEEFSTVIDSSLYLFAVIPLKQWFLPPVFESNIRAFMESHLPAFKEKNPQLEVVAELVRGQHPLLKGFYKNKNERVVCVRNMDPEEVLLHATRLRNALGRKVVKLRTRHVTKHPSVQGTWTTGLEL
ncbi:hypothetical protein CDL15_Pgr010822 [Punica granatum]|uniref:Large ribosomal subunit protein mL43 n=1 Tax=Punica granatum TaxID=22663 RepID=A0A218W4T0_PUNGR|nr:hypothetical protein CDL15_Pgr010822 [Punica granatum]